MTATVKPKTDSIAPAMLKAGLTVRALAEKAGISRTQAGDLRLEKICPSLPEAIRVADALGANVKDLFEHKNGDPIHNLA